MNKKGELTCGTPEVPSLVLSILVLLTAKVERSDVRKSGENLHAEGWPGVFLQEFRHHGCHGNLSMSVQ